MNAKLFQICYLPEHFTNIQSPFEVWDNSSNPNPKLCEFPIFNDVYKYAIENNLDYWGAVSPKFESKAGISGLNFSNWICERLTTEIKPVVFFINPTPINESLSPSVISQGENCHPGITDLIQRVLLRKGITLEIRNIWNYNNFALCNYFVGNRIFWDNYLDFVNKFISEASNNPEDYKMMFETGANYGHNGALPYYTFVVERLFSLFLILNPNILVHQYTYTRQELIDKTKLPTPIIDELRALFYIKQRGLQYQDEKLMEHWIFLRNRFANQYPNIFNVE